MKNINRRNFLKTLGAAASVMSLHQLTPRLWLENAYAAPVPGRKLVFLFQDGGSDWLTTLSHQSMVGTLDQIRPTLADRIINNEYLPLGSSSFMIHPRLTEFQTMFNANEAAFVMKVGPRLNASGSHEEAQLDYKTGVDNARSLEGAGWLQRLAARYMSDPFELLDRTGGSPATLGGPFRGTNLTSFNALTYNNFVRGENSFRVASAFSIIGQSGVAPDVLATQQGYSAVEQSVAQVATAVAGTTLNPAFPNTNLGNQLRDIFIAITNFPTRLAYAAYGGHDLHGDADPILPDPMAAPRGQSNRHAELNGAIAAFRANCQRVGIWQDITVCVASEFGRTNRENSTFGVDHGRASLAMLVGGAVQGGQVLGTVPTSADLLHQRNSLNVDTSIVDVYSDIVAGLGYDPAQIFPGHARTPLGLIRA